MFAFVAHDWHKTLRLLPPRSFLLGQAIEPHEKLTGQGKITQWKYCLKKIEAIISDWNPLKTPRPICYSRQWTKLPLGPLTWCRGAQSSPCAENWPGDRQETPGDSHKENTRASQPSASLSHPSAGGIKSMGRALLYLQMVQRLTPIQTCNIKTIQNSKSSTRIFPSTWETRITINPPHFEKRKADPGRVDHLPEVMLSSWPHKIQLQEVGIGRDKSSKLLKSASSSYFLQFPRFAMENLTFFCPQFPLVRKKP